MMIIRKARFTDPQNIASKRNQPLGLLVEEGNLAGDPLKLMAMNSKKA